MPHYYFLDAFSISVLLTIMAAIDPQFGGRHLKLFLDKASDRKESFDAISALVCEMLRPTRENDTAEELSSEKSYGSEDLTTTSFESD